MLNVANQFELTIKIDGLDAGFNCGKIKEVFRMVEKILGLFFEKRKQSKKDVLLLIFIFMLPIINLVKYITDMDLSWLAGMVSIAIISLAASIYFEGKRSRENDR
ncbi:hypothetical protein PSKAS_35290 [Peribacillus sp. N1]